MVAVVVDNVGHCFGTPKALAATFAGDRPLAVAAEPHTQLAVVEQYTQLVVVVHMPAVGVEHKRLAVELDTELAAVVEHSVVAAVALPHMPLAAADHMPWLVAAPLVVVWHRSLAAAAVVVVAYLPE